jgi:hypothetical protein
MHARFTPGRNAEWKLADLKPCPQHAQIPPRSKTIGHIIEDHITQRNKASGITTPFLPLDSSDFDNTTPFRDMPVLMKSMMPFQSSFDMVS